MDNHRDAPFGFDSLSFPDQDMFTFADVNDIWVQEDSLITTTYGDPSAESSLPDPYPTGGVYIALSNLPPAQTSRLGPLPEAPQKPQTGCAPQIHGATRDAVRYAYDMISREINAVTDNPIVFPDEDEVISGGNFHGQPMALTFDFLKIAVSELADVSERRTERLVNPALSEGLPAFLTKYGGVCSGFMIAQYSAASMVSESKVYDHPASVDSIPSSANQEDHVSMGTTSARTAAMVLDNSQKVIAIEIAAAAQAIWLRQEMGEGGIDKLAPATRAVYDHIRTKADPVERDIIMYDYLKLFDEMIKSGELVEAAEKVVPLL